MMGPHWEYGKKPKKSLPCPSKKKKLDPSWVHVQNLLLIGCTNLLFPKLFVTIFGLG
jgi:hypothetical protein